MVVLLDIWYHIIMDIILAVGLLFLIIGYYLKDRRKHIYRGLGFLLFGVFWILQTPHFLQIGDVFNAIICILALPFFAFLAYNEYLSHKWNEEHDSLKWIAGASFMAGGLYFLIDKIPLLSGAIIYGTAVQTAWLTNLLGFDHGVGAISYGGNPLLYRTNFHEIYVPITGSSVAIIQSCTAVQSMLIFIGGIYFVEASKQRKWKAFYATVPVIYILNLVRNVGIIYMMDELGWSYETAHNMVGKTGSFIALLVLAYIAFRILPELLDNIWGLWDLAEREPKGTSEKDGQKEKEQNLDKESEPPKEGGDSNGMDENPEPPQTEESEGVISPRKSPG